MQSLTLGDPDTSAELVAYLETLILDGKLRPGSRLEPVRVAAESLGLAPNTVAAAYRQLGQRGLVVGKGRQGTFVAERYHPRGDLVDHVPADLIDLASGKPDRRLLPDLAPFLERLGGSAVTYGDPPVALELSGAAAPLLATEEVPVDHLAVTGGALDGVERALAAWLRPGQSVAVEDPGWFAMVDLVRSMGMVAVPVEIDQEGYRPDALADALSRVDGVLITPRAQNPTGAAVSAERAASLRALLGQYPQLIVVEDDHMGPTGGAALHSVVEGLERFAHVRSFAKSHGPDLRTAVVAGDGVTIERLQSRQLVGPGWVSHILQRTVAAMIDSPEVQRLHTRATAEYARRRDLTRTALESAGLDVIGRSGLNLWVRVPDEDRSVASAREAGYAIRPGRRFRHAAASAVRITVAEVEETHVLELAGALAAPPVGRTRQV